MQDYALRDSKPKKAIFLRLFLVFFLLLLFLGFFKRNFWKNQNTLSPTDQDSLLTEIKKLVSEKGGTWSVYVYNLSTNQGFGINETAIFTAASVNKVPILAALYNLAGQDKIDLNQQITLQAEDIQDYGTGSIRYDPPGTTYSVKTLAQLMMEKSDNTAAYILGRQTIGFDQVQSLINNWGLSQTNMENDQTSLIDMAKLFKKMYSGEITNQSLTTEMLGFMDQSDFEDRLPVFLPKDIKVYHKTGDTIGSIHDVGIIDLTNHPYFIGVFTSGILDEEATKQKIAQISKVIFDYMNLLRKG